MSAFRRFLAFASLLLGVLVLLFALLQPERPMLGVLFGALLISNGLIRIYIGAAG
jgi:hypothetical protein